MTQPQRKWDNLRRLLPIVAAIVVGGAIGSTKPEIGRLLEPFGGLYLSLLLMCVIPIIGAAVVSSLGRLVANNKLGKNIFGILLVFVIGMLLAATIGAGVGWLTGVGSGLSNSPALGNLLLEMEAENSPHGVSTNSGRDGYVDLFEGTEGSENHESSAGADASETRLVSYLGNLIPRNLAAAYLEDNYLAVLFFAVLLGVAMGFAPADTRELALGVVEALFDSLLRIISWIVLLLPLGLLCIVAGQVAAGGLAFVSVFRKVILVGVVTTISTLVLFLLTIAWARRLGPVKLLRHLREPLLVAAATSSSFASIPAAMVALKEGVGLKRENVNLFLPLGMTMNPIGSALFFSLSSIFVVQLHGTTGGGLSLGNFLFLIGGSVLAGLAAIGLPGVSALWMLGMVLDPIGIPPEVGIVALLAVAPILDPLFTMVNVLGNCTATSILDRYLDDPLTRFSAGS